MICNYPKLTGTLGELNMEEVPISLQLIDHKCKPVHERSYTVPKSVEQQLYHYKEIVRFLDIEVLKETL
jgi:hypothetical protein